MFENLKIGPFVAIDNLKNKYKDARDILNEGFIPLCLVYDKESPVHKPFKEQVDFETKAVYVTVYYKEPYEC